VEKGKWQGSILCVVVAIAMEPKSKRAARVTEHSDSYAQHGPVNDGNPD